MNSKKNAYNMDPLNLLNGTLIKPKVATVIIINNGKVVSKIHCSTAISLIIAKARISMKILAMFEPMTFPTAICKLLVTCHSKVEMLKGTKQY